MTRSGKEARKRAIKALMHEVPEGTDISDLVFAFVSPGAVLRAPHPAEDRHAALACAAALEHGLKRAIALHLAPGADLKAIFENYPSAPLSSFADRTAMALGLGVITKETEADFAIIREIRNTFAHSVRPISFADPDLASLALDIRVLETETWSLFNQLYKAPNDRFVISCAVHLTALGAYKPEPRPKSVAERLADAILAWPGTQTPPSLQDGLSGSRGFGFAPPRPGSSQD